jgi:pimeloyl-ACP methyl ester carboxylesterase
MRVFLFWYNIWMSNHEHGDENNIGLPETEHVEPGKFDRLMSKIRDVFNPLHGLKLETPTREQNEWVNAAFEGFGKSSLTKIQSFNGENGNETDTYKYKLEYAHLDSKKEEEKKPDDPYIINISGVWSRGEEIEGEIKVWASAMGNDGFSLDAVSMPGHGESSDVPKGWNTKGDFDFAADLIAGHIKEIKKKQPNRKIIINAWSMGGVTALKLAAKYPELVDGLVLIDTPVYPQNFRKLKRRFILYELQKLRSVKSEKKFDLETKLPGLGIFIKRLKERNKKEGMSLSMVLKSAKSLAKIDLSNDGINGNESTLDRLIKAFETKKIPILILRGSDTFVISAEDTDRLKNELTKGGADCELVEVKGAGHALVNEQPIKASKFIRAWLNSKYFTKPDDSSDTNI